MSIKKYNLPSSFLSSLFFCTLFGILPKIAHAGESVPCSEAMEQLVKDVDDPDRAHWLSIIATRTTARGYLGFSSIAAHDGFQIEDKPLHTPESRRSFAFQAHDGEGHYESFFHEVFTDRGNGVEERTRFWIYDSGTLYIRNVANNGSWRLLEEKQCFYGPRDQIIISGNLDTPGYGTDFWTFILAPGFLH